MPKFVPRRTIRYEDLRKHGFTQMEARTLSHIPENVPYLIEMKAARLKDFNKFRRSHQGIGHIQLDKLWEKRIISVYRDKKWWKGKNERSVWEFLRNNTHGEDAYKRTDRKWKSPWVERQRQFRDTTRAVEKGFREKGDVAS